MPRGRPRKIRPEPVAENAPVPVSREVSAEFVKTHCELVSGELGACLGRLIELRDKGNDKPAIHGAIAYIEKAIDELGDIINV